MPTSSVPACSLCPSLPHSQIRWLRPFPGGRLPLAALLLAALPGVRASDFDVVVHEIHYNPLSGDDADEYLEIHNRGPTRVDLSGWSLSEGIHLLIPQGTSIAPKGYLLVSPDAGQTRIRYGLGPEVAVVGNYSGRLDNDGEIVTLENAQGDIVSRLHYGEGGTWPQAADGLGPSLELTDPFAPVDLARHWAASRTVGGTPGGSNSTAVSPAEVETTVLIGEDEVWRYLKGTGPYPASWYAPGFNDTAWESGPTGIGYGDGDDRTELADMEGSYISFAARKRFTLTQAEVDALGLVTLALAYDDAFVGYLNGIEIARDGLGAPGDPVAHDQPADTTHEAGDPEVFLVPVDLFVAGTNVLAVEIHNRTVDSSDASFIPLLASQPVVDVAAEEEGPVAINEVRPSEPGGTGYVEIYNRSSQAADLRGLEILDSQGNRFSLPAGNLAPGGRAVWTEAQLGFPTAIDGTTYVLLDGEGNFADALRTSPARAGAIGFSYGRFPDGDEDGFVMSVPTPAAANQLELPDQVVVNEIHFHPPFVAPGGGCLEECSDLEQWIELHNRSGSEADLSGWSLTKAVTFTFPPGTRIAAGDYLVVAASRERFLASHPAVSAGKVVGGWGRALSHGSDTINLRDALGNRVDHVRYGDGGPLNDEEPADGIDDGTFVGSEWPAEADGSGRTIELRHPGLDNRLGGAWAAGPVGGTPGSANAALSPSPAPVIGSVSQEPGVPRSDQSVTVTCRVSATRALRSVEAHWHRDGGGPAGTVTLRDDGLSGDGRAGDGVWGGAVPPQPDATIVAFWIEAEQTNGQTTVAPRPPPVPPYPGFDGPYYLYQVLDRPPLRNPSESYTVVMTQADQTELESRPEESNVLLYATFVAWNGVGRAEVRHLAGLRYRGAQTRRDEPKPYRLEFPAERDFQGIEDLNLNSQGVETELLAADFLNRAGIPAPQMWSVNLTFQGTVRPRYARKEHLDGKFLSRWFGGSADGGNFYRGLDPDDNAQFPLQADLSYLGDDPEAYRPYYQKRTNEEEDDYSDIIELTRVFDPAETPDGEFADRLEELVDVWQWARFFATQACLSNIDGGIHSVTGEDYFLYRIPATASRPNAGKWVLVPWDFEETYENAGERLFRPSLRTVRRFLTHERFAPYYYCNLINLRSGTFSRRETRPRFRLIDFLYGFGTIDRIDSYVTARLGFIDENVPMALTAGSGATAGTPLIARGDSWRYQKGTAEPSGGTLAWARIGFDDSSWPEGPSGFGYGDGDDATLLDDMQGNYTTVYIRRRFQVEDPGLVRGLELVIDYDDAFVAYLNGREVARGRLPGPPGLPVPFDATGGTREAGEPEAFDLSGALDALRAGTNVLAVQGVNQDIDSSDFSLIPELLIPSADGGGFGCGDFIVATGPSVGLGGRANACLTAEVRVNGQAADWDPFLASWTATVPVALGQNTVRVEAFDVFSSRLESLDVQVLRIDGGLNQIGGTLGADTVLSASAGPYLLGSDLVVPPGTTLTIEPGVRIYGRFGASFVVQGRLQALGTEGAPIFLRAATCNNRWGGIGLDNTGTGAGDPTHVLRYVDVEFGDTPAGFAGCIAPVGAKLLVDHCTFRELTANAVDGTDARVEVRDSFFERIHEGVHCTRSTVVVLDSTFKGMVGDTDGIDFDLNGTERSRIERCLFLDGSDDGIDLGSTSVDIRDNVFVNVQDKALSLEDNGPLGPPAVTGNIIYDCGTAMALKDGVTISEGHNNTIVGNQEGVYLFAKAGAPDGGHAVLDSMIIWDNIADVKLDARSTVMITYSDISQGWPGEGNISADPLFTSIAGRDFSLRPGSPCIGTGKDGVDMGAVPFAGTGGVFVRGDSDGNGRVALPDAVRTLEYLFRRAAAPVCLDRMDANDTGVVDLGDPIFTLFFLYAGGGVPPAPYPAPGEDPTPDTVPCF